MNQIVQVDLASTTTTAYEHFPEIKKALENASLGLYSKYDVQIKDIQTAGEQVIMHVTIPDDIASTFKIGYHLRGVSAYLMKNYRETFSPLIVAKKLLVYTVIPTQTSSIVLSLSIDAHSSGLFTSINKNASSFSSRTIMSIMLVFVCGLPAVYSCSSSIFSIE